MFKGGSGAYGCADLELLYICEIHQKKYPSTSQLEQNDISHTKEAQVNNYGATIKHLQAGMHDYVERSGAHSASAKSQQRTHYSSPQQLRQVMHEHELARYSLQLAQVCAQKMHGAMMRKYSQECLNKEKSARHNAPGALAVGGLTHHHRLTLAEVATEFGKSSAPPGVPKPPALVLVNDQQPNAPNGVHLRNFSHQDTRRNEP